MGGSTYAAADFATLRSTSTTASAAASPTAFYTSRSIHEDLDPSKFKNRRREARNGPTTPKSTPICLFGDETGSMGEVAHEIASTGMEKMITEIYKRMPVTDPQIAIGAMGDVISDQHPLQLSQFEADSKQVDNLKKIYLEGNGGGNSWESYNLPWHVCLYHVEADAFDEGRKGFLFSWGDELPPQNLTSAQLEKVYHNKDEPVATNEELLAGLKKNWYVYHFIVASSPSLGSVNRAESLRERWAPLMGENVIIVDNHKNLPEVMISLMQLQTGLDKADIIRSWKGSSAATVSTALATVSNSGDLTVKPAGGVVKF